MRVCVLIAALALVGCAEEKPTPQASSLPPKADVPTPEVFETRGAEKWRLEMAAIGETVLRIGAKMDGRVRSCGANLPDGTKLVEIRGEDGNVSIVYGADYDPDPKTRAFWECVADSIRLGTQKAKPDHQFLLSNQEGWRTGQIRGDGGSPCNILDQNGTAALVTRRPPLEAAP